MTEENQNQSSASLHSDTTNMAHSQAKRGLHVSIYYLLSHLLYIVTPVLELGLVRKLPLSYLVCHVWIFRHKGNQIKKEVCTLVWVPVVQQIKVHGLAAFSR